MDLQTMISECRLIIGQTDATNSNFSDTILVTWSNEFYRRAAVKLESLPIKERTYTLASTISLNSNTFSIDKAKVYLRPSNHWREVAIRDISDLYKIDPDWENATTGEPSYLIRTGTFTARMYVPPNAANDGQADSLKTHGLEFPTPLSAATDVPDLPANIQDLFPYWMSHKCFMRLGDKDRATEQLVLAQGALKDMKPSSTRFSKGRGWVWQDEGYSDPQGIFQQQW